MRLPPNKWLERTSLRRHGFCGCGRQQPRRLRSPLSHTVESVGKAVFRKMVVNRIKYLRVGKWSIPGFSYRLVRAQIPSGPRAVPPGQP
jgi:hypothetical protein